MTGGQPRFITAISTVVVCPQARRERYAEIFTDGVTLS
jgi:hypothetical protein